MNQNIYTIHDLVAKTYTQPFHAHNDGEARRMFLNWMQNPELPMHAHPADYSLYHIGFYDTDNGQIEGISIPNLIIKGSSVAKDETATKEPKLKAVGDDIDG